jgi:tRNA U34 5-methylaminomethyl-2-thiouridine-forming methyltransferase MnmC
VSVKIITTSDGSHSLWNETLHETYHSVHGAMQESLHVFIKNGLEYALSKNPLSISIFEVGFGTGLNALLTLQYANEHQQKIRYITVEPFPLPEEIWSRLNYSTILNLEEQFRSLHNSKCDVEQQLDSYFSLLKLPVTLQHVEIPEKTIDLIYFDAFAPSKQPEVWELPVLEKTLRGLRTDGILVTYCAKGKLKRDLKNLGLTVETLPGPPGKKEMIRAYKP